MSIYFNRFTLGRMNFGQPVDFPGFHNHRRPAGVEAALCFRRSRSNLETVTKWGDMKLCAFFSFSHPCIITWFSTSEEGLGEVSKEEGAQPECSIRKVSLCQYLLEVFWCLRKKRHCKRECGGAPGAISPIHPPSFESSAFNPYASQHTHTPCPFEPLLIYWINV